MANFETFILLRGKEKQYDVEKTATICGLVVGLLLLGYVMIGVEKSQKNEH